MARYPHKVTARTRNNRIVTPPKPSTLRTHMCFAHRHALSPSHTVFEHVSDQSEAFEEQKDIEDTDSFEWDEPTLVAAMLQEESPGGKKHQEINEKINAFQVPVSELSKEVKVGIVRTLAPAAKRLQQAHAVLQSKIDPAFGEGFLGFDDGCQEAERAARRTQTEFTTLFENLTRKRAESITHLKDAYSRLTTLCADFEATIDAIADHAVEELKAFPTEFDKVIRQFEKKAKELDKDAIKRREKLFKEFANVR